MFCLGSVRISSKNASQIFCNWNALVITTSLLYLGLDTSSSSQLRTCLLVEFIRTKDIQTEHTFYSAWITKPLGLCDPITKQTSFLLHKDQKKYNYDEIIIIKLLCLISAVLFKVLLHICLWRIHITCFSKYRYL